MGDKVLGENVEFKIEVEQGVILLVFDRKCDYAIVPWEDAFRLSMIMEKVTHDVEKEFTPTPREVTLREQAQVRLNHHQGLVALVVEWTDRVKYTSLEAFSLTARAIRLAAQDAHLAQRGVKFLYDKQGMIRKLSTPEGTQHVR